ncbi:hypothetical protein CROQUDRAFT_108804 [Cronartium quercuum f. sp. fusiforme G11]|uniref:Uncharacterized protein n=1 Tax=Cronartium quercuum f. sp. fusiforme G11 TaxID=708437 RepID=A0A9P6T9V1_9BASI|nr:hypothetical protein CROQUDRAFT_108804 [Cronartium quercuum f. sp. fusiforme G11]
MSESKPIRIPGYVFDPVKKRYFKSTVGGPKNVPGPVSNPINQLPKGTHVQRLRKQKKGAISNRIGRIDSYPLLRAHLPISMLLDPELHPGTSASRSRFQSRVQSRALLQTTKTEIQIPRIQFDHNHITSLVIPNSENLSNQPKQIWVGYELGFIQRGNLKSALTPRPNDESTYIGNDTWDTISSHNGSPITSISVYNDFYAYTKMCGTLHFKSPYETDEKLRRYDTNLWCSLLTPDFLACGTDKHIKIWNMPEIENCQTWFTGSSVFALEKISKETFVSGTRSGKVLHIDQRIDPKKTKSVECLISKPGSIYQLKYLFDHNQLLVIGSGNYAVIHDLRYINQNSNKNIYQNQFQFEPIITLSSHQNKCTQSLGFSSTSSLISLAGDDNMIRLWDLKSDLITGMGLQPIEINRYKSLLNHQPLSNSLHWSEKITGLAFLNDHFISSNQINLLVSHGTELTCLTL